MPKKLIEEHPELRAVPLNISVPRPIAIAVDTARVTIGDHSTSLTTKWIILHGLKSLGLLTPKLEKMLEAFETQRSMSEALRKRILEMVEERIGV